MIRTTGQSYLGTAGRPFNALLLMEDLIRSLSDSRILLSFYVEFGRRLYTLELVLKFHPQAPRSWI